MKKIHTFFICFITFFLIKPNVSLLGADPVKLNNDTTDVSFSIDADLVSRYIWRGLPQNLNTNIQPYASVSYKNFTLGTWGSYALANPFAEVDLNLSYEIGAFTFTINDYFNEEESDMSACNYFNFSDTTQHSLEGQITFNGTENFPISLTIASFLWGNDKDEDNHNYYSSYIELGYEQAIGKNSISYFIGGTLAKGYYAEKAALVNVGVTASREIEWNESFSTPILTSFIINPNAKDVFLVFSLTF
jgi:hypothetical protein